MNPLWLIAPYLMGMVVLRMAQDKYETEGMKLRHWLLAITVGCILVPLAAYLFVMGSLFIGLETIWKTLKKVW